MVYGIIFIPSYDKSPYTNRNVKKATWRHKDVTKSSPDYTAIADRLRTVKWSNYSHPTGVVNRFKGPTFPLPATVA